MKTFLTSGLLLISLVAVEVPADAELPQTLKDRYVAVCVEAFESINSGRSDREARRQCRCEIDEIARSELTEKELTAVLEAFHENQPVAEDSIRAVLQGATRSCLELRLRR